MLGLAVLFFPLPLVPGLLFISALVVLSSRYSWAQALLETARSRFPSLFRKKNAVATPASADAAA